VKALGWLLLALLLTVARGAAAETAKLPRGLTDVNVAALASGAERLYVASFDEGLFIVERDGRSRRFEDRALSPHVNALAWSEPRQTLWLGTARGLVRCAMTPPATCQRVGSSSAIHALLLRADGSLVTGGDAGLSFVSDGELRSFGKKQRAPFRSVWSLAEADGTLFVGTTSGLFWGEPGAFTADGAVTLERAALVRGNLPDDWVTALAARDGLLLVGTYNAGVVSFVRTRGTLEGLRAERELGYVNPAGVVALDDGRIAVATMAGLFVGTLGQTRLVGGGGRDVTAFAPARSGGYWVGTRKGLEWLARVEP